MRYGEFLKVEGVEHSPDIFRLWLLIECLRLQRERAQ